MTHNRRYVYLLKKSLSWLREHPYPSHNDVPEELAVNWLSDSGHDGIGFVVFLAGYFQREGLEDEASHRFFGKDLELMYDYSPSDLQSYYLKWRIRLALSILARHTSLISLPQSLFAFPIDEVEGVIAMDIIRRNPKSPPT